MVDQLRFQTALGEFARTLVGQYDVGEVLYRLSDHVTDVLGIDGCGVSVLDDEGSLRFITATNATVERVERIQEETGQGACVESAGKGVVVTVADLRDYTSRWFDFAPGALDAGLHSVMAIPMGADDQTVGALNAYRFAPSEWAREEVEAAMTLSAMATAYVLLAGQVEGSQKRAAQLQQALDTRVVIEQAKGMLAAKRDEPLEQTFERLRRHARDRNLKIHDVARQVVEGRLDL